ncbi:nitrate transporter [Acinetobacter sp. TGL-Y2]|uniref:CmpA/NrtA family ABC transporter substrate-binding protein n=1 Tax=Acinetobacter sp. TGL-Y2 TaxID=1407071 RepID=UPI0007A66B66|nr:CmpA/NrtA family ABC transporter substrate-binding protein [Acinetobacter sp. TGL-Y2]AMW78780.1 nitrate transporter [Acinetobacter sp. TGL-Y2]
MAGLEKQKIQLGYIPLLDCVALLWAEHRGFFNEVGLEVDLVKEASWASLRDRLAYGFLDAAHCLSAMLPAAAAGYDQLGIPLQTPLILSQNHAFITLSQKLCFELNIDAQDSAAESAQKVIHAFKKGKPLNFAHVFKHSIHHYCLREWLALADQNIAEHIQLHTLPPPFMVEALHQQKIDGFCVGEPWNTQAEVEGIGHIIQSGQDIIPNVADKVLAVTQEWSQQNPNTLKALCMAIEKAQHELRGLEEFSEVWNLLQRFDIIRFASSSIVHVKKFYAIQEIIRGLAPLHLRPKTEDFQWLSIQMQKWDKVIITSQDTTEICEKCIVLVE